MTAKATAQRRKSNSEPGNVRGKLCTVAEATAFLETRATTRLRSTGKLITERQ